MIAVIIIVTVVISNATSLYVNYFTSTKQLNSHEINGRFKKKQIKIFGSSGFNWLTSNKKRFIIISGFSVCVAIIQYVLISKAAQIDQDGRDRNLISINLNAMLKLKRSFDSSTISIQSKADSNNIKINKALAKYNLQYNARQSKIEVLVKDGSADAPTIVLGIPEKSAKIQISKDGLFYEFPFFALGAAAVDINFDLSTASGTYINGLKYGEKIEIFRNNTFAKEFGLTAKARIDTFDNSEMYYIWCRGTYKNANKTKTYKFDEVVELNKTTNNAFLALGVLRELIIKTINKHENKRRASNK